MNKAGGFPLSDCKIDKYDDKQMEKMRVKILP